ncbi:lmo0937 family membrane protein [Planococcus sp. CP5-4]|uniref:Lmo0937 family membrane protein n=1 Tax=Planococcus maitriensis TaxID=221799 RepID=A0A365K5V7_9BACL|nr:MULTISPECIES: lmo0937 family membrane protein [Planococcus]MBU9672320.1 lmo0937 family membrane protein [Planococcus sp. CP5-4_YE]MBV0909371.1 lmo0937 family membrane protein [Planococcus sp. CP5-4_UN]MBW6064100.1 lmo0937 family membrane protein [Planococcus sp. CP5-4]RAZ68012.1 lmo0937 family membrane protein [Planococcus maitriensis]
MGRILWIILVVILAVWVIGFLLDVAGGLIHILLIIAAIVLIINLVTGRKGV